MSEHRTYSEEFKRKVKEDIAKGLTIQELVQKHKISEYYARKWSGDLYKKMDMDTLVRRRFKWIVVKIRSEIENDLADAMLEDEIEQLSDETWELWDTILKKHLYEFSKEIIKAN